MGRDARADDPLPILRLRKATQADAAIFPELEQSACLSFRTDREVAWLADADNLPAETKSASILLPVTAEKAIG